MKVNCLMKYELDGKIMKKFAALRAKTYSYLTDEKPNAQKSVLIKENLNL